MKRICFTFGLVLFSLVAGFGQSDIVTSKKNQIELSHHFTTFLDGKKAISQPFLYPSAFRLAYTRNIKDYLGVRASFKGSYHNYGLPSTGAPTGYVMERGFIVYSIDFLRELYANNLISFKSVLGINHRRGYETMTYGYTPGFDFLAVGVSVRDFGLSAGARAEFNPFWNLVISVEPLYTYYPFIIRKGLSRHYEQYFKPSTQSLSLFAGLGVRF